MSHADRSSSPRISRPRASRALARLASLFLAALVLGCGGGGGGGGGGGEATLEVVGPQQPVSIVLGASVPVSFRATDPGGSATVELIADVDADLSTTEDQVTIGTFANGGGTDQSPRWRATRSGVFQVIARMTSTAGTELVRQGPATITVSDASGAGAGGRKRHDRRRAGCRCEAQRRRDRRSRIR